MSIHSSKETSPAQINSGLIKNSPAPISQNAALVSSGTSTRAGQRRLRTETVIQSNVQDMNTPSVQGAEEISQILAKYGNNPDGIPSLLYAIKLNDEKAIRTLLENGASPKTRIKQENWPEYNGNNLPSNAIEYAVAYSSPETIALLESFGADVGNIIEKNRWNQNVLTQSPISIAAAFDNLETFRHLISKGVNIHATNQVNVQEQLEKFGLPVFIAAQSNSMKVFKELLALGADISSIKNDIIISYSIKDFNVKEYVLKNFGPFSDLALNSALSQAVGSRDIDQIKLLLKHGANPSSKDQSQANSWHSLFHQDAKQFPEKYEIMELFISAGVDVNMPAHGRTPIDITTQSGDIKAVKTLLNYGAKLIPSLAANPLQNHQVYSFPEMVQFLVDSGISVNKAYDGGMAPLHYASLNSSPNAAKSIDILMNAMADVHAVNIQGWTPLHFACNAGNEETIIRLLQRGANINAIDLSKNKPICRLNNRSLEIIKAFVQKGANFNDLMSSTTPVFHSWAYQSNGQQVLEYLVENNKININLQDTWGQTIFHKAVQQGKVELIEFLIKKKVDLNIKDKQGLTPLSIAKQNHQELVDWLIDNGAK